MQVLYTHSPADIRNYSTDDLRREFLATGLFLPGEVRLTYTHNDRMIFGGVTPTDKPLSIRLSTELGVDYFLERRELGIINIGGPGAVVIDGKREPMARQDGYYVGKETREVVFHSDDAQNPAKFYCVSVPAHKTYPNVKISIAAIQPRHLGEGKTLNERDIYQYIHPNVCQSCQLQMGYTILAQGSGWNTMPAHTHDRRMETYLYFDIPQDNRVFHFIGAPDETKHIVVANEQAVTSPSWSVHTGVGTSNYSFIWAMCGENITYDDMDVIAMEDLR